MTSVRGYSRLCWERPSVVLSIVFSVASPDFFPLSKSKASEQPNKPLGPKSLAVATSIPKYSKDHLQQICKAILEIWAPVLTLAPAFAPAPIVSKVPWEKLKACSPDVYRKKFYKNWYNFCQQYEDYFTTVGFTGPTQILFAVFFLWDQISFHWQQY